eukprot:s259_g6.t1
MNAINGEIRWVPHPKMIVDGLTKKGSSMEALYDLLDTGEYQIVDQSVREVVMAANSYPASQAFCTRRVNLSDVSPSHSDSSNSPHIGPWPGSFLSSDSSDASNEPFRQSSTRSLPANGVQEDPAGSVHSSLPAQSGSMQTKASAAAVEQEAYLSLPGSAGHTQGMCRPCHYFYARSGCANGENCHFCHLRHTKKPRLRLSKLERQQCRALAQMVFDLQSSCADPPKGLSRRIILEMKENTSTVGDEDEIFLVCGSGLYRMTGEVLEDKSMVDSAVGGKKTILGGRTGPNTGWPVVERPDVGRKPTERNLFVFDADGEKILPARDCRNT